MLNRVLMVSACCLLLAACLVGLCCRCLESLQLRRAVVLRRASLYTRQKHPPFRLLGKMLSPCLHRIQRQIGEVMQSSTSTENVSRNSIAEGARRFIRPVVPADQEVAAARSKREKWFTRVTHVAPCAIAKPDSVETLCGMRHWGGVWVVHPPQWHR